MKTICIVTGANGYLGNTVVRAPAGSGLYQTQAKFQCFSGQRRWHEKYHPKMSGNRCTADLRKQHPRHSRSHRRLSGIIGPGDYGNTHMTELMLAVTKGRLPAVVKGGYDFVDVRDVAGGIISAVEKGRKGECYILSNR